MAFDYAQADNTSHDETASSFYFVSHLHPRNLPKLGTLALTQIDFMS